MTYRLLLVLAILVLSGTGLDVRADDSDREADEMDFPTGNEPDAPDFPNIDEIEREAKAATRRKKTEGFEAIPGWAAERWGDPVMIKISTEQPERGKALVLKFRRGDKHKAAVALATAADLSASTHLTFEICNLSNSELWLSFAFKTMPGYRYYESAPITIPPRQWRYDLAINLASKKFKSAATRWQYRSALLNRHQVRGMILLIYNPPKNGTLIIDRIRAENRRPFSKVITLPHLTADAAGVAAVDIDGDRDSDLFFSASKGHRIVRNNIGESEDVTRAYSLSGRGDGGWWADVDLDGDLDLISSSAVLRKMTAGRLHESEDDLPTRHQTKSIADGWFDADGDGTPDILMHIPNGGPVVLLNNGKLAHRFGDRTREWQLRDAKGKGLFSTLLAVSDLDGDGYPDLLGYGHTGGVVARNMVGRKFVVQEDVRFGYPVRVKRPLPPALGDMDNDGDQDILSLANGRPRLLRNNGGFQFSSVKPVPAVFSELKNASAAVWVDADKDGLQDIVIGFVDQAPRLYINVGEGQFRDATAESAIDQPGLPRPVTGIVATDWDGDGDSDLVFCGGKQAAVVLINAFPRRRDTAYSLRITAPTTALPGTTVRLLDSVGRLAGYRELGLPVGQGSQAGNEALFHVGKGAYTVIAVMTDGGVVKKSFDIKKSDVSWMIGEK